MKLSKRLKTICDLIPENKEIIDIGADHALIDIYLEKYKNCKCLATDISENAIKQAKKNIKKYDVKVETKVTDGLNNINLKNQIIIISGMGAHTIMGILNKKLTNDIIISSHNKPHLIRKFMQKKGYHIEKEIAVLEKHCYVIMYFKYGKKRTNNIISPFLKDNKDYMKYLFSFYQMKSKNETNKIKKIKYKYISKKIRKVL